MTWRPGPLKYWLDLNDSGTWGDDPIGSDGTPTIRSTEINLDGSWNLDDVAVRFVPAAELKSKRLRRGDLVVVKSSGSADHLGKTAIVTEHVESLGACFANFVQRLRPSARAEPRFVWYLLNSQRAAAELEVLGNTTTGLRNLNGSIIGSVTFPGPPLERQRSIAEFLDTETTLIDALITKKRCMIDLLRERYRALVDYETRSDRYVPLHRVTDLLPGFMFASDDFDPQFEGERLLRGVNVGVGALRWNDQVRLRPGAFAPERYRVREHDVVVGMDRPFIAGGTRVAMVDEKSAGALLVQRVCRIRASSQASATVVANLLGSRRFEAHVEPDLTGVSVPHLSDSQIGSFPIPLISGPELEAIATRLSQAFERLNATTVCLESQVALLQEHRQAIVTAAVTGELEVPGVAA